MNDYDAQLAIDTLVNTRTRQAITDFIDQYGDAVDWSDYSTREILQEVWRSDCEAGEPNDGILAAMHGEL